ncbi:MULTISPECIES: hypothetical protein [Bacillus]|uniref:hypothetical protein n=1 Tax=Bacillus TaxID=1386 RepID=UPI0002059752|nr:MULTISPECIES: hypothetical protein [Bacillus amyloliquefaciens group]AIW34092.1 hypothetical protein KS08_10745 [Bacillus subtilis]AEB23450.1 hypothetical protein BAMTA208_06375 [Bacillus amyloliquefaciens TA208]AEK88454.1 hypothetical protein; phage SPbeta [Bacillus amyloliquefaciens XH7]APH36094.1 hypothetical protein BHE96_11105 [Bacillus subtilis]KJR69276.1 hypothetical protein BAGR45_10500 [Bacillus velezensis]
MIGIAYFLILWLGVGFLTGFKALFVDQVYDEEFKQELIDSFSPGMEQNMIELFFKNKINIMVFYILIGLLPLAIKIAGLLKRS